MYAEGETAREIAVGIYAHLCTRPQDERGEGELLAAITRVEGVAFKVDGLSAHVLDLYVLVTLPAGLLTYGQVRDAPAWPKLMRCRVKSAMFTALSRLKSACRS